MDRRARRIRRQRHRDPLREPRHARRLPGRFCGCLQALRLPSHPGRVVSEHFRFPDDFLWGAATAAYQIEGSPLADGAGASIWHRFSHTPGNTANGDTGDIACDHYRRYEADIALMRELGLKAYRLSISWSRIFPEGKGQINQRGIDFYSRLIDRLLENGVA